jgi:hypothetical protein
MSYYRLVVEDIPLGQAALFWLDGMVKAPNHIPLYLPVWTLQELMEANEFLELVKSENSSVA